MYLITSKKTGRVVKRDTYKQSWQFVSKMRSKGIYGIYEVRTTHRSKNLVTVYNLYRFGFERSCYIEGEV